MGVEGPCCSGFRGLGPRKQGCGEHSRVDATCSRAQLLGIEGEGHPVGLLKPTAGRVPALLVLGGTIWWIADWLLPQPGPGGAGRGKDWEPAGSPGELLTRDSGPRWFDGEAYVGGDYRPWDLEASDSLVSVCWTNSNVNRAIL